MAADSLSGEADRGFEAVFVCTGNRARSPLAEALYRRYTAGLATTVASYGTLDAEGLPALPQAVEAAALLGVSVSGHHSRALRGVSLARADLVLGFEPHHLSAAVVDARARIDRTFLLGELVALLDVPAETVDLAEMLAVADSRRARSFPDPGAALDDPVGRPRDYMLEVAQVIDDHVRRLVRALFGADARAVGPGLLEG